MLKPEEIEARAVAQYLDLLQSQGRVLVFSHIANETYTKSWSQKSRNKAMGVRSGIPDYVIVTPNYVLFLELKRVKGGVLSKTQKEWLKALSQGKRTTSGVARGFDEAKKLIDQSLPLTSNEHDLDISNEGTGTWETL